MKNLLTLILILALGITGLSQTKVLEKEVPENVDKGVWGPNLRHYGHFFVGIGMLPEFDGTGQHNSWTSSSAKFGYRYKLKVFNFYALGLEAFTQRLTYRIKSDNFIINPNSYGDNTIDWDNQLNRFLTVGGSAYQRINFDRRGNFLGKYLDVGISANYIYGSRNVFSYQPNDGTASKVKVKEKGLTSLEETYWGLFGRIGFNKFAFTFNYRMSPMFEIAEVFEPYQIGIEIGF
jgi:hypothetical protein